MTDRSDSAAELPLGGLTDSELAALICRAIDELSGRGTREGFAELLRILPYAGQRVGDAARLVAESDSWSQVAEISGTSRQAAWERWRMA